MLAFHELTTEEQAVGLQELGSKALAAYGLQQAHIQLIKHEMNTIFKVTAMNTRQRGTYVLRVVPANWLDYQTITSEAEFLTALAHDSDLMVSEPVPTLDGLLVSTAVHEAIPEPRHCLLFRWLEGEFCEDTLSKESLIKSGEFLARLHEFGKHFRGSEHFTRPTLDLSGLFAKGGLFDPHGREAIFSAQQVATFREALDVFQTKLAPLELDADQHGFLHGDYYFKNILFHQGKVGAIDFDMCGYGLLIFDLIMPYWPQNQGSIDEAYEYFFQGYRRVRPLPEGVLEYRATFEAIRRLIDAYFVAARDDHPLFRQCATSVAADMANALEEYLRLE